jgi:hypothetical protein
MGHGGRGRRQCNLPVIPGLPELDFVTRAELKTIGQTPRSESRFPVRTRSHLKRRRRRRRRSASKRRGR